MFNANDPFGEACRDRHFFGKKDLDVIVHSDIAEDDVIPVDYLFRTFPEMPLVEQTALKMAQGRVLDLGAGTGSHALWLQELGLEVSALDHSPGCVQVMEDRGVKDVVHADLNTFAAEPFDTVLLLMNGAGLCGRLANFPNWIKHISTLLKPGGQILLDSSDLIYLYEGDPEPLVMSGPEYYGHVTYQMSYKAAITEWFPWLYLDIDTLLELSAQCQLKTEIIQKGPHHDYLARITL